MDPDRAILNLGIASDPPNQHRTVPLRLSHLQHVIFASTGAFSGIVSQIKTFCSSSNSRPIGNKWGGIKKLIADLKQSIPLET
jgi:hypothetical protein